MAPLTWGLFCPKSPTSFQGARSSAANPAGEMAGVSGNGAPGVICCYTNIRSCLPRVACAPCQVQSADQLQRNAPFYLKNWPQNRPHCNSLFAESPLWETIVRNEYVSFRQNITQWDRKKFMAGWLHLYAVRVWTECYAAA